ncbi:MAG: hypothetical protein H6745_08145 [Deltaproteobacteria bacterium]|nr:hypothetical protein [Deltaproteobacteria bacterium]
MPLLTAACASSAAAPSLAPVETPPPLEATLAPGDHAVTVHALGASLERAYFARPFWCPAAETLPYDAERERAALCVDTVRVLLVPLPTLGAVRENFNYPRLERHLPSYPHVAITPEGAIDLASSADLTGPEETPGRFHSLVVWILTGDSTNGGAPTPAAYDALAAMFAAARRSHPRIVARMIDVERAEVDAGLVVSAHSLTAVAPFDVLTFCDAARAAGTPLEGCPGDGARVPVQVSGAPSAIFAPWPAVQAGVGVPRPLPAEIRMVPGWSCSRTEGLPDCRYIDGSEPQVWDASRPPSVRLDGLTGRFALIAPPEGAVAGQEWQIDFADELGWARAVRPFWCPRGASLPPTASTDRALACVDAIRIRRVTPAELVALPGQPHVVIDAVGTVTPTTFIDLAGPPAGTTRDTAVTIWVVADPVAATGDALTPIQEAALASVLVTVKRLYPRIPPLGPAPVRVDSPGLGLDGDAPIDWARLRAAVRAIDPAAVTP